MLRVFAPFSISVYRHSSKITGAIPQGQTHYAKERLHYTQRLPLCQEKLRKTQTTQIRNWRIMVHSMPAPSATRSYTFFSFSPHDCASLSIQWSPKSCNGVKQPFIQSYTLSIVTQKIVNIIEFS